ncbi:MAG: MFS transporter [Saprospiraceae bacterium]|nr:MFS transporter [Saprospiraceae bacterium]
MLYRLYTHWLESYRGIPRVIWYISIVSLVNRCGAFVISFLSIYMTKQLGFPLKEAGYVMTCFGVGALAGAFAGGKLTDRLGYHPIQFWSLLLNGIILLLMMMVRDIWVMGLAVLAMSFSSEVFRPANSVAMARHCEADTRTRSISLYRMAVNLGWTIAPALGGMLVAIGWKWLFWIDGLTCMAAAFTLLWLVPEKAAPIVADTDENGVATPATLSPYRNRTFLLFTLLTMLGAMVFMQILWTIPLFWEQAYGWSEGAIGKMIALNGAIVFLVEMPLVHRLEGRNPPMQYVRFGLVLYALSYAACLLPYGWSAALAFTIIISFGEIFVMPFSSNFVFGRSEGAKQGQYMALYTMAWSVANILAPLWGTQVIAAWGYNALWSWAIAQSLITLAGFYWLERRTVDGGR